MIKTGDWNKKVAPNSPILRNKTKQKKIQIRSSTHTGQLLWLPIFSVKTISWSLPFGLAIKNRLTSKISFWWFECDLNSKTSLVNKYLKKTFEFFGQSWAL